MFEGKVITLVVMKISNGMFIFRIFEALWIIDTVESQLLERITNSEIGFFCQKH